jgi:SAM-dependent methyltransferase
VSTQTDTLATWEQAEIERSSNEASRRAAGIRATPVSIVQRYAAPPHDTPFPLEYAYAMVGDVRGCHVLDMGCGTGADATLLAMRGAEVSAVDISPDLLELATYRSALDGQAQRVTVRCGSAHAIPVPDQSVDLVFGNAVLHHVDLELTAREVHRVLKPGGRAVFKEPIRDSRALAFVRRLVPYRQPDVSPFERPLRRDEIRAFGARFGGLRTREFELPFVPLARLLRLPRRVLAWLQRCDAALLRRVPFLRRFASICVFEVAR